MLQKYIKEMESFVQKISQKVTADRQMQAQNGSVHEINAIPYSENRL